MLSSVSSCRWAETSASMSSSELRFPNKPSTREAKTRRLSTSCSLRAAEQSRHDSRHAFPALGLAGELLAACARQRVILRLAVVVRQAPLRIDPSALFEPEQGWIKGALIELHQVLGNLLNALRDPVAMQRTDGLQRFQHDQVQRSLKHFAPRWRHPITPFDKQQEPTLLPVDCQQVAVLG